METSDIAFICNEFAARQFPVDVFVLCHGVIMGDPESLHLAFQTSLPHRRVFAQVRQTTNGGGGTGCLRQRNAMGCAFCTIGSLPSKRRMGCEVKRSWVLVSGAA